MRYFLAILLPPVAVLSCGKPFQALGNILLTMAYWVPGMLHALFVVHNYHADQRARMLERAYNRAAATHMGYHYE